MLLFERMRSCDLYDIVWFVLKERLITILIMFSRDKADVQYGRDRKSEIAFFRKKKKFSNRSSYFERHSENKD